MNYIILDLEWNQPRQDGRTVTEPFTFDSEIIEFGAVKLDDSFALVDRFRAYVKPYYYTVMNTVVSRLTKITMQSLQAAPDFPSVYHDFLGWCGSEHCLMTWGPDDIPVLMDNLLIHGMSLDSIPDCFDLQRIFGHEIMRDDRQCSLERAMEILKKKPERAHDALNDAVNTAKVCDCLELASYLQEYCIRYVFYREDRLSGLSEGRVYNDADSLRSDSEMTQIACPYCGETIVFDGWTEKSNGTSLAYARCGEGDEFIGLFRHKRLMYNRIWCSRLLLEMNDDLWDIYQDGLERQSAAAVT